MDEGQVSRKYFKSLIGVKQSSQINQEANRYGFELLPGGDVDLGQAYLAIRNLYQEETEGDKDLKEEKLKEEIEKLRHHNFEKRISNEVLAGSRIEVSKIKPLLDFLANEIREAGDLVARKSTLTGKKCQAILNKCVDKLEREIDRTFDGYSGG